MELGVIQGGIVHATQLLQFGFGSEVRWLALLPTLQALLAIIEKVYIMAHILDWQLGKVDLLLYKPNHELPTSRQLVQRYAMALAQVGDRGAPCF